MAAKKRGPKTNAPRRDVRGGRDRSVKPHVRPRGRAVQLGKPCDLSDAALRKICRTALPGYDPWKVEDDAKFDVDTARRAIDFFHTQLVHVKGAMARKPFYLEPWEQAIVGNVFGWLRPDRTRRYRESLVYVPRKNGKTPLAAGIILYLLFEDGEYGAEIMGAAYKYSQAALIFHHARGMVGYNPALKARCQVFKGQAKSIQLTERPENVDAIGVYTVVSGEKNEGHGALLSAGVIDELHLQVNRELVDNMRTATASEGRVQPLLIHITTADFEREGSICNQMHDKAKRVIEGLGEKGGISDPSFLPVIFEASREDDWRDEKVWWKANPNLGVSVSLDYLRRECKRAQEEPSYENTFKRLHLNIRTEQETRWLALDLWDKCDGQVREHEPGDVCYAGLDLAQVRDMTALVLLFPNDDDTFDVVPHYWMPDHEIATREREDGAPYLTWQRQGLLTLTPGNVLDFETIRARVAEVNELYDLRGVAYDPWNATYFAQRLQDEDGVQMRKCPQTYAVMSQAYRAMEHMVTRRQLRHAANPILRWNVSNAAPRVGPNDAVIITKTEDKARIDGAVAMAMAIEVMKSDTQPGSVYDNPETAGLML